MEFKKGGWKTDTKIWGTGLSGRRCHSVQLEKRILLRQSRSIILNGLNLQKLLLQFHFCSHLTARNGDKRDRVSIIALHSAPAVIWYKGQKDFFASLLPSFFPVCAIVYARTEILPRERKRSRNSFGDFSRKRVGLKQQLGLANL